MLESRKILKDAKILIIGLLSVCSLSACAGSGEPVPSPSATPSAELTSDMSSNATFKAVEKSLVEDKTQRTLVSYSFTKNVGVAPFALVLKNRLDGVTISKIEAKFESEDSTFGIKSNECTDAILSMGDTCQIKVTYNNDV